MSALRQLFSKPNLILAWGDLKSRFPRYTTPGIDGVTRDRFAREIESEAERIAHEIRSGSFRFQRLKPIAIPKANGKIRLINVPTIRDRFVQRVLLRFLVNCYGTKWKLPNSFSSMQGDDEGVHATLRQISRSVCYDDFVIKADLSSYFDTIDRSVLKKRMSALVRHRSLHRLIFAAIDCETSDKTLDEKAILRKSDLRKSVGIRQGMPISPVLAYLFLMDVDKTMGGGFFRYVDDLLFIGESRSEVEAQFALYRDAVEARGVSVHKLGSPEDSSKTKLIGAHESFDFLGVRIRRSSAGNKFRIPSSSKARIEEQIKKSVVLDPTDEKKAKGWVLNTSMNASNLVRNYKSAYHICDDWSSFERALKGLQLSMCRQIARQLSRIERDGNRGLLLRVFGI